MVVHKPIQVSNFSLWTTFMTVLTLLYFNLVIAAYQDEIHPQTAQEK